MCYNFKVWRFFLLGLIIFSIHSCESNQVSNGIIEIDAYKEYPELDLNLDDIAEISYIHLKLGKDTTLIMHSNFRPFFVTGKKIFIADGNVDNPRVVVYNHSGEPLYTIGQKGRGPGELLSSICFAVDTIGKEVFLLSPMQNRLVVYDIEGNYKRSVDFEPRLGVTNIDFINDSTLIGFNPKAVYSTPEWLSKDREVKKRGRALSFIDKESLALLDFPDFNFERIYNGDNIWSTSTSIVNTGRGFYFFSICCDTTYFINDSLEITPRFVDISKYPNEGEKYIFPGIETKRYIFLATSIIFPRKPVELDEKNLKLLAYDKVDKKIYTLNRVLKKRKLDGTVIQYSPENINLLDFMISKTLNKNYLAKYLYYSNLQKNYEILSDTLKKITDKITEDDNPVLMLIKFK